MPPLEYQSLDDFPAPLRACAYGRLPANVVLMQMVQVAHTPDDLEANIQAALVLCEQAKDRVAQRRLNIVLRLWRETPAVWEKLRAVCAVASKSHHSAHKSVEQWAMIFDKVCAISPEASVALYSLGRSDLLNAATEEIVAYMRRRGLLGTGSTALEIGCGTGRFLRPLSSELRLAVGLDISMGLLRQASRRCAGLSGIALVRGSGRDLASFSDAGFDLIYAVDSFPYLFDAGADIAAKHVQEAARLLKPEGVMLIFNYSYRGNRLADWEDLTGIAQSAGLSIVQESDCLLSFWDGVLFRLAPQRSR